MFLFKNNDVSKASVIFLLVAVLQFGASFLLIPVYLSAFSVEEFGINEIINRIALFAGIIIALRISGAMANIYFTLNDEYSKRKFVSSLAGFTILSGIGGFLFFLSVAYFLLPILSFDHLFSLYPHGICALLTAIAANIITPYFFYLKNEQKFSSFFIINFLFIAVNLILQLIAIYFFRVDFDTLINIRSGFAVFQFLVMLGMYQFSFSLKIDWSLVRRALSYTIPLIPFLVLNWLQLYYDRFFVGKYLGVFSLGVFSFVLILQNIQGTLTDVFENAIRPALMGKFIEKKFYDNGLANLQNQFLLSLTLSSSGLLFITILLPLFTSNHLYLDKAYLFMLVVPSGVIKGMSLLFMQQLIFKEKSVELGVIVAIHFASLFLAYHFFARDAGLEAVLFINIFIGLIMMSLYFIRAQKALSIPYNLSQFYFPFFFVFMVLVCYAGNRYLLLPAYILLTIQLIITIALTFIHVKIYQAKRA
jgi:O-antigen/teichoic acid export membrane protein